MKITNISFFVLPHLIFVICVFTSINSLFSSVNIIKDVYIYTGNFGLYFIGVSLVTASILPLIKKNPTLFVFLSKIPKICGNYALFFGILHFINFVYLDSGFSLESILHEISEKNFLLLGFIGLVSMILVLISSNFLKEKPIDMYFRNFTYFGFFCICLHFFLSKKMAGVWEYSFIVIGVGLLLTRIIKVIKNY